MDKFEINWLEDTSDEALLAEVRRVASMTSGERLTKSFFASNARVGVATLEKRFGTWSEATRRAGLSNALPEYSDEAIIADLMRVADLISDNDFTQAAYLQTGSYSVSTIRRRFGGWKEALERAGLTSYYAGPAVTEKMRKQVGRQLSDEEIILEIQRVAEELGKTHLSGDDIVTHSDISQSQMHRRFGSISAALKKAGIAQVSHGRRYTEEEIFENLISVWTHYGRRPKALEMDEAPSTVGKNAYIKRYGGWRNALRAFVEAVNVDSAEVENEAATEQPTAKLDAKPDVLIAVATNASENTPARVSVSRNKSRVRENVKPEDRRDIKLGLRFKVLRRDSFKCKKCGNSPAVDAKCVLHVDHIIPFSRGGKTVESNLEAKCRDCNLGKGNRYED